MPVVNEMDVPLIGIFTGAMSLRLFQRNRLAIKTGLAAMLEANPNAVVMSAPARRWRRSSGKRVRQA